MTGILERGDAGWPAGRRRGRSRHEQARRAPIADLSATRPRAHGLPGNWGLTEAEPVLCRLLDDRTPRVGVAARQALDDLTGAVRRRRR
ncbi:MAG TPA: hypothetical protein VE196_05085 [Pseudonocardiaceae bacterium]|nr:hypothetical protein [Pseudonocardiaceae bacterium]